MMQKEEADKIKGTVITTETTITPDDPSNYEYPFPDEKNSNLFNEYKQRAEKLENILICGRLGEYRYFDMDQAIGRAMILANGILTNKIIFHDK